ncbi:uncharacterized protein EDB93DRAFT_1141921 [Suillus bovinus]|uniref:uncharacterized protein n=1 Tax=Suillus bovinus TaxID=48563 RepID=UPI001B862377|nr:uncharacterized protein EDB93DRAFT_1141921 [Suillus bovinus]KAG2150738.1 hypothetical protein EDB93DRAFT_1141921 [Suillus bovinus]
MSISKRLDNAHEVVTKLSSDLEHTPSPVSSLILPTITNLNSSNPSRSSTCFSLGHMPTVKFAPLPLTDPSRRRSNLPLGVAARSRRRRPAREGRQQGRSLWTSDPPPDPLFEDPFITLGKFVKSATKNLWRRVRERNGLVDQVEPIQHDVVIDIRPMDNQEQLVEVMPEHRQVVISEMGTRAERPVLDVIDNNLKWRRRRTTGSTMPSSPGLY